MKFGVSASNLHLDVGLIADFLDRWLSFGNRSLERPSTTPLTGLLTDTPLHDIGLLTLPTRHSPQPLVIFWFSQTRSLPAYAGFLVEWRQVISNWGSLEVLAQFPPSVL